MEVVPVVPQKIGGGNTRISPSIHWFFTLNNPTELDIALWKHNGFGGSMVYCVQLERGENGTPHLQGYVNFGKKVRPLSVIDNKNYHWEKCKKPNEAIAYCSKEDTRIDGPWTSGVFLKTSFLLRDLHLWQKTIVELVAERPHPRIVTWVVDTRGGKGKTALCKHLIASRPNRILYVSGKGADIKYAVHEWIKAGNPLEAVLFDFVRSAEDFVSYDAIESIKNGIFFNTKYESGMCMFEVPHVICFSNWMPKKEKLSADRWNIMDIDPVVELVGL